jgi:DNA-binding transcriptional ArsR family regulator
MPRSRPIHPRPPSCAELLKALADESRLGVVQALLDGPLHVHELGTKLEIEQSLLSHHLRALRSAGLVEAERDGKTVLYSLAAAIAAQRRGKEPRIDLGCCQLTFR